MAEAQRNQGNVVPLGSSESEKVSIHLSSVTITTSAAHLRKVSSDSISGS